MPAPGGWNKSNNVWASEQPGRPTNGEMSRKVFREGVEAQCCTNVLNNRPNVAASVGHQVAAPEY